MSAWMIYLFGVSETLRIVAVCVFAVSLVGSGLLFLSYIPEKLDGSESKAVFLWYFFKKALAVLVVSTCCFLLIPDRKTIAAMYVIPYVTSIEGIKDIPQDFVKVIHILMEEYLKGKK